MGYDKPRTLKIQQSMWSQSMTYLRATGRLERRAGSLPGCVAAFSRGTPELSSAFSGQVIVERDSLVEPLLVECQCHS